MPNEVVKLRFLECKNFQVRNVKGAVEGRGGSEGRKNMKIVENTNLTNMFENTKASKNGLIVYNCTCCDKGVVGQYSWKNSSDCEVRSL